MSVSATIPLGYSPELKGIKTKLAIMNFMEFAVWGSYLVCLGNYLVSAGLGSDIPMFYAIQGIVSIFMPALMGVIADKWVQPQRLLGFCHFFAGIFMILAWHYGSSTSEPEYWPLFSLYTLSVAFFMPTIALANTVAFTLLKRRGLDTVKDFPPIRVLGTIGFIAAMWFVNCFYAYDGSVGFSLTNPLGADSVFDPRFSNTVNQLLLSGMLSIVLFLYCMYLPKCPLAPANKNQRKGLASILGLDAFKLFRNKRMAMFFIFSMLLGVSLHITNGFATPFITSFKALPEYLDSFGANNATLLTSLSQISEALCILLIPFFLKRYGIKKVMMIAMGAWVLRFAFFGLGNPGDGVWLFILSMIVYGVAFDFFNVSGALFVEQETDSSIKASAQGMFMLMTNGIGATVGTLSAGYVINHFTMDEGGYKISIPDTWGWSGAWLVFAAYALVVLIAFGFMFKYKHVRETKVSLSEAEDIDGGSPEGMTQI